MCANTPMDDAYEVNINIERQNLNKKAWLEFVGGKNLRHKPAEEILQGWIRCKKLGVDPYQKSAAYMLSEGKIVELREENRLFLNVSRPTMENLFRFVSDSGFIVALSDKHGYLLEVFGKDEIVTSTMRGKYMIGADWSEKSAGNNIIGSAIFLNKPVMVIGYEHYCMCSHHWAGAGAPIHDILGNIIGTISLAGRFEKIHYHTLGMIVAAANAIEVQLSMKEAWNQTDMAKNYMNTIINSITDGVIGTDSEDRIIFCNKKAYGMLNVNSNNLLGKKIDSILDPVRTCPLKKTVKGLFDDEIVFKMDDKYIRCIGTSQQIIKKGTYNGLVIVIREYDRATQFANKMMMRDVKWSFNTMIGKNPYHLSAIKMAQVAAKTDSSVLLLGESGTGKDIFAQAIHNASYRKDGPYVAINCGAIPKDLISSELFGYCEGAFTGARKGGSKGKFELASGGTIFLDEIGEMPLEQQAVLLRVLEEKAITKIGGTEIIPINVRIIAATSRNLQEEINLGKFRQELYYRLNVFTIKLVPLRERKDDIKLLANSFLSRLAKKMGNEPTEISDEILKILLNYDWPGNIRELQNILERTYMLSKNGVLTPSLLDLPNMQSMHERFNQEFFTGTESVNEYEAAYLRRMLKNNNWNITKTCHELGFSRTTLYRKLHKYRIAIERSKKI